VVRQLAQQGAEEPGLAEIAALAKAWKESFNASKMEKLNADVSYYIDDEGYQQ
jgi:hypothetical protein